MREAKRLLLWGASALAVVSASPALSQEAAPAARNDQAPDAAGQDAASDEIVVIGTGSRLPADVTSVPGTVTLIDSAQIATQSGITNDLGTLLAQEVPSLGPSTRDGNNFSQTLRGRKPAFFIDGLPQSISLRGGGRDLRILNPNVLERIEVIHGATSIYGLGGSGGIVNYITKRPKNGLAVFGEAGFGAALSNLDSEGFDVSLNSGFAYGGKRLDILASANVVSRGLLYDSEGDPLPPDPYGQTGIADTDEWSLFGKLGYKVADNVRLEFAILNYELETNTDYTISQGDFAAGIKSMAEPKRQNNFSLYGGLLRFDFIGTRDPSSRNTLVRSGVIVDDILGGSSLEAQVFYQDARLIWRHIDFLPPAPTLGGFPPNGSQLKTDSSKRGARIDINTPLSLGDTGGFILWGGEYMVDKTGESLVDGRQYTSTLRQKSGAVFAQAQIDVDDRFHIRGGLRYDDFDLDIPDFMALDRFDPDIRHTVIGTDLDYSSLTGNFGAVFDITGNLNVFASWSNGFSIGDVLRSIRGLSPRVPSPPQTISVAGLGLLIKPVKVDSYEAGIRYSGARFRGHVTGFYNTSELGSSFDPVTLQTVRAPERIWGVEAGVDFDLTDRLEAGAAFAVMDSKTDSDNDGTFDGPLDFSRVPPPRMVNHVAWRFVGDWKVRLQADTIFDESRFTAPFATFQRDIKGYTLFDLYVAGPVTQWASLSLGVENLFNKNYVPMATLLGCADDPITYSFCYVKATGARATVRLSLNF